jgi:hypothetical protein
MNEINSIDEEYAGIEANVREFNKSQTNPHNLPHGFYLAKSPEGRQLGFGFYCTKCKIHVPGRSPNQVKHCGKVSQLPEGLCYNKTGRLKFLTLAQSFAVQRFWWQVKTVVLQGSGRYFRLT